MEISVLVSICVSALFAVFIVLLLLAILMRLIIVAFPEKRANGDLGIYAALAATYSSIYQELKITKIEEIKWFILRTLKKYE